MKRSLSDIGFKSVGDPGMKTSGWRIILWIGLTLCITFLMSATPAQAESVGAELFKGTAIPVFEIQLDKSAHDSLSESNRTYVKGTVTEGSRTLKDVGIRLKGRATYQPLDRKPSLTIKFNEYSDQAYLGLTKIMLNNSAADGSCLREYLANQMFREAGLPAPRVTHARVKLNDRDLGLYVVVEGITRSFLRQHFSQSTGNLYEGAMQDINARLEQDGGSDRSRKDLKTLIEATQVNDSAERWRRLSKVLDVNRFMSFMAMEQLVGQTDGYTGQANNYRIYHDPDSDLMVVFPHGLDTALSETRFVPMPPLSQILTRAVLQTHEGRQAYRQALTKLFTNVFNVSALTNRAGLAAARLKRNAVDADKVSQIESNYAALCRIIERRASSIAEQLAVPELKVVQFDANGTAVLSGWKGSTDESAEIDLTVINGEPALHINSSNNFVTASFRTRILLEPGKYVFAGEVRLRAVETWKTLRPGPESVFRPNKLEGGVALHAAAGSTMEFLTGDVDWKELAHEFEIKYGPLEVELACELRAGKGEAWFKRDSLRLIRK